MFPPRYPRSPNHMITINQNEDLNIPLINNQRLSSQQRKSFQNIDNLSKRSKYQNIRTQDQQLKALGRRRYINQLAQLDYQDKFVQIHTKYTMASKISAMKKIKSKNQMAQFLQQQEQEQLGFQQLMDYKYGKQNQNSDGKFVFQRNQTIQKQYIFCAICDQIHNDHPEVHQNICKQKHLNPNNNQNAYEYDEYSKQYNYFSLKRINNTLNRMINNSQQYEQLRYIFGKLIQIQEVMLKSNKQTIDKCMKDKQVKYLKSLFELFQSNQNDMIFVRISIKILKDMYKRIK